MSEWEKGKLTVNKSKKGDIFGSVSFTDKTGKVKTLQAGGFVFSEDMNGKEIEFFRKNGLLESIRIDGKEIPRKGAKPHKETHERRDIPRHTQSQPVSDTAKELSITIKATDKDKLGCPSDTSYLIAQSETKIDNFALGLQKFARINKDKEDQKDKYDISDQFDDFKLRLAVSQDMMNALLSRNSGIKRDIESAGYKSEVYRCKPECRFVIGLGSESVYETSMTFHHVYGIPYIPGSAVKGVTRSWVIINDYDQNEKKALENNEFIDIFGSQDNRGKVIFMDAYPIEKPIIEKDIMNPHFSKYYSGEEQPPADYLSPTPIFFLTVTDTPFEFMLISKNNALLQKALGWLKDSLSEHGIGAKTALGYGYFSSYASFNNY